MTPIDSLIGKLEQATDGSDRALADEVLLACGWTRKTIGLSARTGLIYAYCPPGTPEIPDDDRPNPLASLDSALTLVPDGFYWEIKHYSDGDYAKVAATSLERGWMGVQKPAPISLCIAALKARTSMESNHE